MRPTRQGVNGRGSSPLVDPADMPRVAKLGIIVNWSPHWSGGYFGTESAEWLGQDRFNRMYQFNPIISTGGIVALSSDVASQYEAPRADPFLGLQVGHTRIDPWWPMGVREPASGCLALSDLVKGYTLNGAIQLRKGRDDGLDRGRQAREHGHPQQGSLQPCGRPDPVCAARGSTVRGAGSSTARSCFRDVQQVLSHTSRFEVCVRQDVTRNRGPCGGGRACRTSTRPPTADCLGRGSRDLRDQLRDAPRAAGGLTARSDNLSAAFCAVALPRILRTWIPRDAWRSP